MNGPNSSPDQRITQSAEYYNFSTCNGLKTEFDSPFFIGGKRQKGSHVQECRKRSGFESGCKMERMTPGKPQSRNEVRDSGAKGVLDGGMLPPLPPYETMKATEINENVEISGFFTAQNKDISGRLWAKKCHI